LLLHEAVQRTQDSLRVHCVDDEHEVRAPLTVGKTIEMTRWKHQVLYAVNDDWPGCAAQLQNGLEAQQRSTVAVEKRREPKRETSPVQRLLDG